MSFRRTLQFVGAIELLLATGLLAITFGRLTITEECLGRFWCDWALGSVENSFLVGLGLLIAGIASTLDLAKLLVWHVPLAVAVIVVALLLI